MTLRTPRRRISPRTRKRYRAIKDFFKRAIGTISQTDFGTKSSIVISVTDLNHKIVGLEQKLSEVSRTCHAFKNLDDIRKQSHIFNSIEPNNDMQKDNSPRRGLGVETKVLYKSSDIHHQNSDESEYTPKLSRDGRDATKNKIMNETDTENITKHIKSRNKVYDRDKVFDMDINYGKHKTQQRFSACSIGNFHSLSELREIRHVNPSYYGDQPVKRPHKTDQHKSYRREEIHKQLYKSAQRDEYEDKAVKHSKIKKSRHETNELDQDFIADIIKRQYKPVKMFDRRNSDLSQFSEPMCRDRDITLNIPDNIQEETEELCACCYGSYQSPKQHLQSDSRSVCDARLYRSKRKAKSKYRRVRPDAYNDTELYDLIPVKEKASPKTRRKYAQDNLENYHSHKEVPPSPRTQRPRLNLKSHYATGSDDDIDLKRRYKIKVSPKRRPKYQEPIETLDTEPEITYSKIYKQKLLHKQEKIHQGIGTIRSEEYPQNLNIEPNTTVDNALNKTQETISSDKTDRALCEIKDILQSFLQEIKNEASLSAKSDVSTKVKKKTVNNANPQVNTSVGADSGHSYDYSVPQCNTAPTPYLSPYQNPCCYPVMPMYPINCMQTGYAMPSQSITCCCTNKTTDTTENNNKVSNNETSTSETDNLIKEIYKLVVQSPTFPRKQSDGSSTDRRTNNYFENRGLTSRSTGGSTRVSRHDAMVGTPQMKCYSKSCEAIGSRMVSDTNYSGTNAVYSDTAIENISLEPTTATTSSDTENSTDRSDKNKAKNTKFGAVLRTFGLFKKKNNDAIEEVSESESTVETELKKKRPYRQEVTNYMMNSQDFYHQPPVPQDHHYQCHDNRCPYPHDCRPPYNPDMRYPEPPANYPQAMPHRNTVHEPRTSQQYKQPPHNYHPGHQVNPPGYPEHQRYPGNLGHQGNHGHQGHQGHQGHPGHPDYPSHPGHPGYQGHARHSSMPYASNVQPQVPLCLKEIEVKSMATQSERKMSFFRKMKQKIHTPEQVDSDSLRNFSTQTKINVPIIVKQKKPSFWQSWQTKAMEGKMEPLQFSYKQQQKLAAGDKRMRNAMLKKMFHKRNPFSPNNLIMSTLLGKDKSSYGQPPMAFRPRMFV